MRKTKKMEAVGLGLTILAELRVIVKSIQDRRSCAKEGPALFAIVDSPLTRLRGTTDKIADIVRANPGALLQDHLSCTFGDTLSDANDTLALAENSFDKYSSKEFIENSSRGCPHLVNEGSRLFQAKSLTAIMNEIQKETSGAENKLQHLLTQLGAGIHAGNLQSSIHDHCFPNK